MTQMKKACMLHFYSVRLPPMDNNKAKSEEKNISD